MKWYVIFLAVILGSTSRVKPERIRRVRRPAGRRAQRKQFALVEARHGREGEYRPTLPLSPEHFLALPVASDSSARFFRGPTPQVHPSPVIANLRKHYPPGREKLQDGHGETS
jgi:hypothetical protein